MPAEGFLAVDVGGTAIKYGFVVDGKVEAVAREPVAPDLDGLIAQLERLAAQGAEWGVCVPGLVEDGVVRYAANLPLRDTPLPELVTPRPRVFANDLVAATVGEAAGGTLALLQVGTGVAARFALEGRVLTGGEVGHLRFGDDGPLCSCGRHGCVEAYVRHGDSDSALEAIGFAAAVLVAAWDPGTLRLGGGVVAARGDELLDGVRNAVRRRVLPGTSVTVEPARLGDSAALIGLAALARSAT